MVNESIIGDVIVWAKSSPKCLTVYKRKQNIKFKAVSRIEDQTMIPEGNKEK